MKRPILLAVTLVAAALSFTVLPPPAGAAEVSAKSQTSGGDPAGDVPSCKGDIVSYNADWTDERLMLQLVTACNSSPEDQSWYDEVSGIGWYLDTNNDDDPDYIAVFDTHADTGPHAVLFTASGTVVCDGEDSWNGSNTFAILLAADCMPRPFTFVAGMVVDENPNGDSCICEEDLAPDASFAGPVYRGAPPQSPPAQGKGYWMLGRTGNVYAFGDAGYHGNSTSSSPRVDLEPTPSGRGYWILAENGSVSPHGDAGTLGSIAPGQLRQFEAATAISRTPSGAGYWVFTNLGRVFSFGDARFFGDMSGTKLNGPVLDAIPTPSGNGYYMVGSDGGIFTFGDAEFRGSMGDFRLNAPVQSLVPDDDGRGYWLVASDGGIFSFDAEFYGSMGSTRLNKPITGMVGFDRGYLMVGEDGGIFTFGDAPFYGSLGDNPPATPIVSTAILNQ